MNTEGRCKDSVAVSLHGLAGSRGTYLLDLNPQFPPEGQVLREHFTRTHHGALQVNILLPIDKQAFWF